MQEYYNQQELLQADDANALIREANSLTRAALQ
jgi:hypothetical protein